MTSRSTMHVVVVGAGMTGLTTAILLARGGHRVTVLERDPAPPPGGAESAWSEWERPGVNQFRLAHLMLARWRHEVERELPDLLETLLAAGAARVNLLHLQRDSVTHGWLPGDEAFDTVTARRPVLEAALSRLAEAQPRLTVRRGVRVSGLLLTGRHVGGLRTTVGTLTADLVVDAAGRRTSVPDWLNAAGVRGPTVDREDCGFVYFSRHYVTRGDGRPRGTGSVLTHYPSISVLTLPCDLGTHAVVLVTSSRDRALRALRDEHAWTRVVGLLPAAAPWLGGAPLTGVQPLAGLQDIRRTYVRDGQPVVTGLVAVGDSATRWRKGPASPSAWSRHLPTRSPNARHPGSS